MRRTIVAVSLLAAFAVVAGCGATTEPEQQATRYTASDVVQQFKSEPGSPRLRRAAGVDTAWEQLGLGLNVSDRLLRRYGVFTVYVVEPGNEEAVDSLLTDKATGKPLQPDEQGVYWELDTQSKDWIGYSKYGENVILAWFGGTSEPKVDARWQRLNRLMSGLALS